MTRTAFSRLVHFALGFAATGAALLCQQHVQDVHGLRMLSIRCILIAVVFGILWEHVVQEVIAMMKPKWGWSRSADNGAAAAFPIGAVIASLLFLLVTKG